MAWYRTGTINVTNGSTAVTGVGTRFASNARVGDGLRTPDGEWYEIVNIASETTLGIFPAYQGATGTNQIFVVAPLQGYVKESADRLRKVTEGLQDIDASVTDAKASAAEALSSKNQAQASEAAALASKNAAATSATDASNRATAAQTARTGAETARTQAQTAQAAALVSQNAAKASEDKAKAWATNQVDIAVDSGQYSALHWATKAKESADGAAAVVGPRLTSIAQAVLAVNDMLIANTATTMVKISTGALGRTMLGAANAAAGRTALALGTSSILDVTTSSADSTANRLIKTGDFGIGTTSAPLAEAIDSVSVSGEYFCNANTVGAPTTFNGTLKHQSWGSSSAGTQTYTTFGSGSRQWRRTRSSNTWSNWWMVFDQNSIVGSVGGNSGNPTGSVIERGSNTNGDFVKFADGTLICWITKTDADIVIGTGLSGGFRSSASVWTFPSLFSSTPSTVMNVSGATAFGMTVGNLSTSQVTYSYTAVTSQAASNRVATIQAVGRWSS